MSGHNTGSGKAMRHLKGTLEERFPSSKDIAPMKSERVWYLITIYFSSRVNILYTALWGTGYLICVKIISLSKKINFTQVFNMYFNHKTSGSENKQR